MIKKLASRIAYENKWMKIHEDDVEFSDGSQGKYYVLEKPDAAIVIPERDGSYVMVKPYRHTTKAAHWEFPCGGVEEVTTSAEEIARQELSEETGYVAGKLSHLTTMHVADGYSSQLMHVFSASELKAGETRHEPGEVGMEIGSFSADEVDAMVANGEMTDSQSIAAWGTYRIRSASAKGS